MTGPRQHVPAWRSPFSWPWIIGLALLAVPRALFHDLAPLGPLSNAVLAIAPPLIWILVVVTRRAPHPFVVLLVIGCVYGAILGVVHEATWTTVWDGHPPRLGGNLEGRLSPAVETALMRIVVFISSFVTGAIIGAVSGLVGWAVDHHRARRNTSVLTKSDSPPTGGERHSRRDLP